MVQSELALQFTGHGCSALPENAADTVYFMEGEDGHLYTGWADGHQGPIEVACSGPGAKTGWSLFKGSTPRDLRLIDHGAVAAPGGYDPPHIARGGGFAAGSQLFAAAGGGFAAAAGGAAAGDGGASGGGSASVELAGRYPCAGGSFDGVLYQGTYAEDNGANVQGRACPQSCGGRHVVHRWHDYRVAVFNRQREDLDTAGTQQQQQRLQPEMVGETTRPMH